MTEKIMPLRERDTSTIQAAIDAFLSSLRDAIPNTRRGYTGVPDRLLAGLGAGRPPDRCSCPSATPAPPTPRHQGSVPGRAPELGDMSGK